MQAATAKTAFIAAKCVTRRPWRVCHVTQAATLRAPPAAAAAAEAMSKLAAKLTPLLDRVLVEKVAAKTKTVGGILLPESAASKARPLERAPCRGRIARAGGRVAPP